MTAPAAPASEIEALIALLGELERAMSCDVPGVMIEVSECQDWREQIRSGCDALSALQRRVEDLQAVAYANATLWDAEVRMRKAAESRLAARDEELRLAREALERIGKSDINNFETLHPSSCAQVARATLARLSSEQGGSDV
jgi:hypothetical protein